jgi:hypothetical protein
MVEEPAMRQGDVGTRPTAGPARADDLALTETQNWGARSHRELYDAVHIANEPGRVGELAQEWRRLGQEMGESAQLMAERLRATEAGWQGEAATAARAAIQQLADWNRIAGETASDLGARIADQGRIMEVAKTTMPEPVESDLGPSLARTYASNDLQGFAQAAGDARVPHEQAKGAHQQAIAVATRMETESRTVDGNTPRFTPPPDPIRGEMTPAPQRSAATPRALANESASVDQPGDHRAPQGQAAGPGATDRQEVGARPGGDQPGGSSSAGAPDPAPKGEPNPTDQHRAVQPPGGDQPEGARREALASHPGDHRAPEGHSVAPKGSGTHGGTDGQPGERHSGQASGKDAPDKAPTRLESDPGSTTSQGAPAIPHTAAPAASATNVGGGEDILRQQRPMPDGSPAGGQNFTGQGGAKGSGGSRSGWSGQVPPPPSSGGGPTGSSVSPPSGSGGSGGGGSSVSPSSGSGGGGSKVPPPPSSGNGPTGSGVSGDSGQQSGGRAGVGPVAGQTPSGEGAAAAQPGTAPAGAMGGAPAGAMGGAPGMGAQGQGGEEKSRSAKYVEGGQIVEVPGADLPPPVIGEGKKKPKDQG